MDTIKITWPDILNYLADRGYFTALSPIENKLHDGLLIKLNILFFPEYLEISNTELHGLTGLSIKAIIQARESLTKKQCYDNWVWKYESRERQRLSGHYFFNYELIRNWIGTRQELKRNSPSRKEENLPNEYARIGNDHNKQNSIQKKTTTNNSNKIVVDEYEISKGIKEEIVSTLNRMKLSRDKVLECINMYGWGLITAAFCATREKYENHEIENFAGYFLETAKGMSESE